MRQQWLFQWKRTGVSPEHIKRLTIYMRVYMDPLLIGDRHFDDSRHFVSILSISRQFAGRHFAITFVSIYCRHFAEMITYIYIYLYCIYINKVLINSA